MQSEREVSCKESLNRRLSRIRVIGFFPPDGDGSIILGLNEVGKSLNNVGRRLAQGVARQVKGKK